MIRASACVIPFIALSAAALAQTPPDPHVGHAMEKQAPAASRPVNQKLPPGADQAAEALKTSPRHHEWVDIKVPGSTDVVKTFVVYPERKEKAPVVLVIHEIFGLRYESRVFENAGHGFLRQQTGQDGANMKAIEQAWPFMLEFLRTHTK
jgi:hypothetical protein